MSDVITETIVVDVVVDAPPVLVVDVIVPAPIALAVDVLAPPPAVEVVEIADFGTVPIGYPQLPVELRQLPISFPYAGRPAAGTEINLPMSFALTVPVGLAGTVSYAKAPPAANAVFLLNRLSETDGVVELGTITLTPASRSSCLLTGAGGLLEVGDVMQLVAPEQDLLLADVGITILANRM
jgi:hypothetical protein